MRRICVNSFTTSAADVALVLERLLGPLPPEGAAVAAPSARG